MNKKERRKQGSMTVLSWTTWKIPPMNLFLWKRKMRLEKAPGNQVDEDLKAKEIGEELKVREELEQSQALLTPKGRYE